MATGKITGAALGHRPSISALTVRDFKSLARGRHRLEIRPLTVLAGANSSGKSSALQPLLLLKQTFEASYDPGPLLLHGSHVRLTSPAEALSRLAGYSATSLAIGIDLENGAAVETTLQRSGKYKLTVEETRYEQLGKESISLRPDLTHAEVAALLPPPMVKSLESDPFLSYLSGLGTGLQVFRHRTFLTVGLPLASSLPSTPFPPWPDPISLGSFELEIRDIIHVPGLRGNPERAYTRTAVGGRYVGTFENYAASVIHQWQINEKGRVEELGGALARLGLTSIIVAEERDAAHVELKVGRTAQRRHTSRQHLVNIADVGFGVSQVLPVVVALTLAEPGRLVYLEQPEIHLHPKAQVELAAILVSAANRGVRVVAETHSELLLVTLQALIAEGAIEPKDVAFHWFTREADGSSKVTAAELSADGSYGEWPEDFGSVLLQAEGRYLDAAEARHGFRT